MSSSSVDLLRAVAILVTAAPGCATRGAPRTVEPQQAAGAATAEPSGVTAAAGQDAEPQNSALRLFALRLCTEVPHRRGAASCPAAAEEQLPRCRGPFLAGRTSTREFVECLGFLAPPESPPAAVLAQCEGPSIAARLTFAIGRAEPWPEAVARRIDDERIFVAEVPVVDETDLLALRLEERGDLRSLHLELSPAGSRKLSRATAANVGSFIVISLGGEERAARIEAAITTDRLMVAWPHPFPADVCATSGGS